GPHAGSIANLGGHDPQRVVTLFSKCSFEILRPSWRLMAKASILVLADCIRCVVRDDRSLPDGGCDASRVVYCLRVLLYVHQRTRQDRWSIIPSVRPWIVYALTSQNNT